MPPSSIATAADYADAMMIARRAKNWLFLLLLLMLLIQLAVFFVAQRSDYVLPGPVAASTSMAEKASTSATTAPSTQPLVGRENVSAVLRYVTAGIDFLGIVLVIVLVLVLSLIVKIMLVGRLIGVAQVTSAFIWCIFLGVLLFPWQAFLQNSDFTGDFKIPGVLYTWAELVHPTLGAKFHDLPREQTILRWVRFVGFPVVAVIILLLIQTRSSRGLRAALGEGELEHSGDLTVS